MFRLTFAVAAAVCIKNGLRLRRLGGKLALSKGCRRILLSERHLPYVIDVAHHFDTYFNQVVPYEDGSQLVADFSEPKLHRLRDGLEFELSSLPEEMSALDSYFRWYKPTEEDITFDVGAYCGVFTYQLSKRSKRVIAFEPDPLNHELLKRNIARHQLTNVTVVQAALCDINGQSEFNCEGALGSGLSSSVERASAGNKTSVVSMDFETACNKFGTPSFVKIDAEGAEIEIISGALDFLRMHRIWFALDTNHMRNGTLTCVAVESLFRQCGYAAESTDSFGMMTTWARPELLNIREQL